VKSEELKVKNVKPGVDNISGFFFLIENQNQSCQN